MPNVQISVRLAILPKIKMQFLSYTYIVSACVCISLVSYLRPTRRKRHMTRDNKRVNAKNDSLQRQHLNYETEQNFSK